MIKRIFTLCFLVISVAQAQEKLTAFGLQYKPIVPAAYFDAANVEKEEGNYTFNLNPRFSNAFGMVIRHELTKTLSIESGLNFIQRNYRLHISNQEISLEDYTDFGIRSYELPIQLLAYIQLNQSWYMNASFGISQNTFASDVFSRGKNNNNFYQNTGRRLRGQRALLANLGYEYRGSKKGYYYFGASLHRPWKEIARIYPEYDDGVNEFNSEAPSPTAFYLDILGNFITIDFRYFFHE